MEMETRGSGSGEDRAVTPPSRELERADGKVVLGFSLKPATSTAAPAPVKLGLATNPLKAKPAAAPAANPLKRPNVFKAAASAATPAEPAAGKKRELTAAERIMYEDQERKRRRMEREAGSVHAF